MTARRFCPFCGARNRALPGQRHRSCPSCGATDWQNPGPAVGVALLRGGKVLLSKRAAAPKKGQWDLVGGFVEGGETPEQAAAREVEEETGLRPAGLRLRGAAAGSYAGAPTLNFLFTGRVSGTPKAADDSEELRWFPLDAVPPIAWPHEAAFVAGLAKSR